MANPPARRPIDVLPGEEHEPIECWEGDVRDFADVGWALRRQGLIPDTETADAISTAYRDSRAVQATAHLLAARVLLDTDAVAAIRAAIPQAARDVAARPNPHQRDLAGDLLAAVATLIRDTPRDQALHETLTEALAQASADTSEGASV